MLSAINSHTEGYNLYNLEANFRTYLLAVINLKAITVKNYLSDIRYFIGWYQQQRTESELLGSLKALDRESIEAYKHYLQASNLPSTTINRRLSTVRMFCKFLIDQNILSINPAQHMVNVGSKAKDPIHINTPVQLDPAFLTHLSHKGLHESEISTIQTDVTEFLNIINSTQSS